MPTDANTSLRNKVYTIRKVNYQRLFRKTE